MDEALFRVYIGSLVAIGTGVQGRRYVVCSKDIVENARVKQEFSRPCDEKNVPPPFGGERNQGDVGSIMRSSGSMSPAVFTEMHVRSGRTPAEHDDLAVKQLDEQILLKGLAES